MIAIYFIPFIFFGIIYYLYFKYKVEAYASKERKFESLLVGHRGSRGFPNIPENSLVSFKYSIERGVQAIEVDCRLTKDGHVVVIHDDKVRRLTTSETGSISEMTLDDVKKLSYRNYTDENERIPTLHEVMDLVKSYNVKLFVEIKCINIRSSSSIAKKVCDIFYEHNAYDWACIIAFNPLVLYHARMYDPKIECCLLYSCNLVKSMVAANLETVPSLLAYSSRIIDPLLLFLCKTILPEFIGCTMIGPDYKLLSLEDVLNFKRRGQAIYLWVANTKPDADFFIKMHCSTGTDCYFPKSCNMGKHSVQEGVTRSDD